MKDKNHDYFNKCKNKSIWNNSIFIPDKNIQQTGYRGNVPEHNKGSKRQAHS